VAITIGFSYSKAMINSINIIAKVEMFNCSKYWDSDVVGALTGKRFGYIQIIQSYLGE